jgi:WD40 repeat protein
MRNIRTLQQIQHQRIESDLVLQRMSEQAARNIESMIRGLLFKGTGYDAVIIEGLVASAGSGMVVNLSTPAPVVQMIDGDDIRFAIDHNDGDNFSVSLTAGAAGGARIDIIESQISRQDAYSDTVVYQVNPSNKSLTQGTASRDKHIYLAVQKKDGTVGSGVAPSVTAATAGIITSTVVINPNIDLSARYILAIAAGIDAEFVEVDCRGASPATTTLAEIITALNAAGFGTIASNDGSNHLRITGPGTGENSLIRIKRPTMASLDAYGIILGGTMGDNYCDPFVGTNKWFKVAEINVPQNAVSITDANIIPYTKTALWTTNANSVKMASILEHEMDETLITSNIPLHSERKYKTKGAVELSLPGSASEGQRVEIFSEGESTIVQTDADHAISYFNKYWTTKGVNGRVIMPHMSRLIMTYQGNGDSRKEPFVRLADPFSGSFAFDFEDISFSPCGTYMGTGLQSSPYLIIYKRSGDIFVQLPDPDPLIPSFGYGVSFSRGGIYLAVAHYLSPYIAIYKRNGDTFTKLGNPDVLPTGYGNTIAFSPCSTYLALGHSGSPCIMIYKRNGDAFNKLTNPADLPTNVVRGLDFSPCGHYLAVGQYTTPFFHIYRRIGDTFTKLGAPTAPASSVNSVSFSPCGTYLAAGHDTTPYITIYKRNGDIFTILPDPNILPTGDARGVSFSPCGTYLAVAHSATPYITIYKRSYDTFIKVTNPADLPPDYGKCVKFSPSGDVLVTGFAGAPHKSVYKTVEAVTKKWLIEKFDILYPENLDYKFI